MNTQYVKIDETVWELAVLDQNYCLGESVVFPKGAVFIATREMGDDGHGGDYRLLTKCPDGYPLTVYGMERWEKLEHVFQGQMRSMQDRAIFLVDRKDTPDSAIGAIEEFLSGCCHVEESTKTKQQVLAELHSAKGVKAIELQDALSRLWEPGE